MIDQVHRYSCLNCEEQHYSSFYNLSILLDKLCRYEEAVEYAERAVDIGHHALEHDDFERKEIENHINFLRQNFQCI